ncbi:hypothetical protein IAT38_005089 [Cryptococcus sp. DSM 104549]
MPRRFASTPSPSLFSFDSRSDRSGHSTLLQLDELVETPFALSPPTPRRSQRTPTLNVGARAFNPTSSRTLRKRRSELQTPEPVLLVARDTNRGPLAFSSYYDFASTSALSSRAGSVPPSLASRQPSRSAPSARKTDSDGTPTGSEKYYSPLPSPLLFTPDLTPDSSQSLPVEVEEFTLAKEVHADLSIFLTSEEDVAELFRWDITASAFPTEEGAEAAGDRRYELPEDVRRLVDIESQSDGEDTFFSDIESEEDTDEDETDVSTEDESESDSEETSFAPLIDLGEDDDGDLVSLLGLATDSETTTTFPFLPPPHSTLPSINPVPSISNDLDFTMSLRTLSSSPRPSVASLHPNSPYRALLELPSPRLHCPDFSSNDALQYSVIQSWKGSELAPEKATTLLKFLGNLSDIVNQRFGDYPRDKTRFLVDVFGSVSWGGETGQSGDVDLIILDQDLPEGYHPHFWRVPPGADGGGPLATQGRRPKRIAGLPLVYDTFKVANCLRAAGMGKVQPIVGASTPINKFEVSLRGWGALQCDINTNDLGGWYNSSLILHYCRIAPFLLRPMIHALKLWASSQQINDPSGSKGPATMSSYCLTLMAIAYLQYRGCLPNLQANVAAPIPNYPHTTGDKDAVWVSWGRDQGIKAFVGFDKEPPAGWTSREPGLTASQALRGFFEFFSAGLPAPGSRRFDWKRDNAQLAGTVGAPDTLVPPSRRRQHLHLSQPHHPISLIRIPHR